MSEYTYTDPYGCRLRFRPSGSGKADVEIEFIDGTDIDIPAADLPTIVAEMHRVAGQPNPLADRPGRHVMQDVLDRRDLVIERSIRAEGAVYFGQSSARGWHIRAVDLPELVGALYKAAGQEPPIVLPRLNWHGTDRTAHSFNGVMVTRDYKMITLLGRSWNATTTRGVATVLAELAEAADAELDPEQVRELAEVIRDLAEKDVLTSDDGGEEVARALLRAGYVRTEGRA